MCACSHSPCKLLSLCAEDIYQAPVAAWPPWQAAAVAHCYDNSPCRGLSSGGERRAGRQPAREKKKQ